MTELRLVEKMAKAAGISPATRTTDMGEKTILSRMSPEHFKLSNDVHFEEKFWGRHRSLSGPAGTSRRPLLR